MKGQLSAEMLIVLAIVLGLVFIVFTQMTKTTKDVSEAVDERGEELIDKSKQRISCSDDADCQPFNYNQCVNGYCQD